MEQTLERVVACLSGAAASCKRPVDMLVHGDVPDELLARVLLSGKVRRIVPQGEPAEVALVSVGPDAQPFDEIGYLAANAVVVFDPRVVAPIAAIRLARRAWASVQPWVLPLEGPDALSQGVIFASAEISPALPRFSCSMPVNLEVHDVERVLASFLPISAEWVVGVDEKSNDGTLAIVERYADVVFRFRIEPWSFAAARNQTLDRCAYPWIFQTEGHEHLDPGSVGPLRIVGDFRLPRGVLMVPREIKAGANGELDQVFSFPWVFRNHPALRFSDQNGVHNALEIPRFAEAIAAQGGVLVRGPDEIRTIHKAHPENRHARHTQAKEMNRTALEAFAEDAEGQGASRARFYAMQEHARAGDVRGAVRAGFRYLKTKDRFAEQAYEGHITLGELLMTLEPPRPRAAIRVLLRALPYDLHRVEADILLGDAHMMMGDLETAKQCYSKATGVDAPAYANLFVRKRCYLGMPWIGLAVCLYKMGDYLRARAAAQMALRFEPDHEVCQQIAAIRIEGEDAA